MEQKSKRISPLAEAEMEVLEEGREWMRQRLAKKLQSLANEVGEISPPEPAPPDTSSTPAAGVDDKRRGNRD